MDEILQEQLSRTALLLGGAAMERLAAAHVAVFGLGGVGGHAAEALARSGVGTLTLVDGDTFSVSNLNRQLFATRATVGMPKVDAAAERLLAIDPELNINRRQEFFTPENAADFDFAAYDYVVDAIDNVTAKIALIIAAQAAGTPIISCMGAGNKLDATRFEVADIYQTSVCPLAKVMRRELKKRGVTALKVVYSREEPLAAVAADEAAPGRHAPGSCAFVPAVAGLILAGEAVKDLADYGSSA